MTFREAIMSSDLNEVYAIINKRDVSLAAVDGEPPTVEQTEFNYSRVVKELLSKPPVKAYSMPFLVTDQVDPFDKTPFIDVCLRNRKYVKPPKGAKPWGGVRGKKVPKGKYNCNLNKYNERFSIMGIRWSELIDTPIENKTKCSIEEVVSHILWELTFDGWTEEKAAEKTKFIMERIQEAEKDVHEGKCVTLPPTEKGGLSVVIPDSVNQQLMDIVNKMKK